MAYDPFAPGRFKVDRVEARMTDTSRDGRVLPIDVWFPEKTRDKRPLLAFSHTSGGDRRQASYLCRHLASHGYVVATVDHTDNTAADVAARAGSVPLPPDRVDELVSRYIADRVPDIRLLIDEQADTFAHLVDTGRIGLIGYSFGGWAVLATPEQDDRVRAIVAMAPAGNSKPLPGIIPAMLTFDWRSEVSTLFLVAERDRFTPIAGQYELLERAPGPKRMFILRDADHGHFGDEITDPGATAEHAHLFTRGLAVAHFDAVLGSRPDAAAFLDRAVDMLRQRGVAAALPEPASERG